MSNSLQGKVALVTGASSGIGRAMARRLAAEGASIVAVGRSEERLRATADELGTDTLVIPADLTRSQDVEKIVSETHSRFGRIDVLLANAGLYIPGDIMDSEPDSWDELLAVNVNSVFRLIRLALPDMIKRSSGDIIVTSSISGHQVIHWEPIYNASKHAVQAFVHGVRRQVAPHNIRVGAVAPGVVLNELWGVTDPAEVDRRVKEKSGLRSEDVAEAVLFMLTRPAHVTIRDLVILPQRQDL